MPYPPEPEIVTPVRIGAEALITNLLTTIRDQRTAGLSDSVIAGGLVSAFGDGTGGLGALRGAIRERTQAVQQHGSGRGQFQAEVRRLDGRDPGDELYMWNAVGNNTCVDCTARHGMVRSWDDWQKIGLPGRAPTKCRFRCRCYLMHIDAALTLYGARNPSDLTTVARRPIVVRRAAIAAQEEARGRPFAESTIAGKVGQFREEDAPRTLSGAAEVIARNPDVALAEEADRRFRRAGRNPLDPMDVGNLDYGNQLTRITRDWTASGRLVDGQIVGEDG